MQKPSPQFVSKLEQELRLAYRTEFRAHPHEEIQRVSIWKNLFKILIPAASGIFVVAMILLNFTLRQAQNTATVSPQSEQINAEARLISFNEGNEEADIINDLDSDELNQIESNVTLAAAGEY